MIKRMKNWFSSREDAEESSLSRLGVALGKIIGIGLIVMAIVGLCLELGGI